MCLVVEHGKGVRMGVSVCPPSQGSTPLVEPGTGGLGSPCSTNQSSTLGVNVDRCLAGARGGGPSTRLGSGG